MNRVWVARFVEGYTGTTLWVSHHKTPEGASNACQSHHGSARKIGWEQDWTEYVRDGYRQAGKATADHYEILCHELNL